jgi:hypothetical protein
MPTHDSLPGHDLAQLDVPPRPAPRCYLRQGTSKAVAQSRIDGHSNAVVLMLGAATFVAAMLIVYAGWSF